MSNFSEWWEGLSLALKVYWCIAIPFTIFFVLQLILTFFGGDLDDDTLSNADGRRSLPFPFLTIKSIITFLTVFGWAGIMSADKGASDWWSVAIAGMSGFLMMFVITMLGYLWTKGHLRGAKIVDKAVGETGQVSHVIPAHRASLGQVLIKVEGITRAMSAITDDDLDLPNGKTIVVMKVLGDNTLLVTEK